MNTIEKYLIEICERHSARLRSEAARLRNNRHDPLWLDFLNAWDKLTPLQRDCVTLFVYLIWLENRINRVYEAVIVWLVGLFKIDPREGGGHGRPV